MSNTGRTPSQFKRLLVYATQHMPTGGIESHLRQFCECMAEAGVSVDLFILNSRLEKEDEDRYRELCQNVYFGKGERGLKRIAWLLVHGLRARFRPYDAFYTNGQGDSVWLFAATAVAGRRWVHHHHTSGDEQDERLWSNSYRAAMQKARGLIACSNRNAESMTERLGREVRSIPCFSRAVLSHSENKSPGDKLRFGYYGRLIPEKGIDHICKLAADPELVEVEFHIWGEGDAYPARFFENHPSVHFHGSFSGANGLCKVLGTLDAFLLLSTHPEGLPISLLEAMSAGLPWIATDRGGIADIACEPSSTRILPSDADFPAMKNAIVQLASDLKAGLVSTAAQKELYRTQFSKEVLIQRWKAELGLNS